MSILWAFLVRIIPEDAWVPIWRFSVVAAISIHIAWSCGWLPGMSGFAMADTVQQNTGTLNRILAINLADRIDRILAYQCEHPGDRSRDEDLHNLLQDYLDTTGKQYSRPSCDYLRSAG